MNTIHIAALLGLISLNAFALPTAGLKDLNGAQAKVDHTKNKELVVFWATWCPECKEKLGADLPKLNQSQEVAVVTINTDRSANRAQSYVERSGVKLPVLRDDEKRLRKELKVFSVPHWAVYERADQNSDWKLVDSAPAFQWDRINKALKKSS